MITEVKEEDIPIFSPGPTAIDISPDQSKGVLKEIITPGTGEKTPRKGNNVFVHFTGKLLDGTKFESSIDHGQAFDFILGRRGVIKGLDIGVATMKKGEKCIFYCHPDYAYGEKGKPPKVPENATLVFEVELLQWRLEDLSPDKDEGILRSLIIEGEGWGKPGDSSIVEVELIGRYNDLIFEQRDVKFEIGLGSEVNIVEGLEIALQKFKKGEKSKIILKPKYAFGTEGNKEFNITPDSTVDYEVTLKNFYEEKDTENSTPSEKFKHSEKLKNKGTQYFKKEKFSSASNQYESLINYLEYETGLDKFNKKKRKALLLAGYLNLAACYLKLEKYDKVKENCDRAIELDTENVKAHFRKGQAHLALREFEFAKESFSKALENDFHNKAARKNLTICNEHLNVQYQKEKKMYQTMFKKMSQDKD